MNAVIPLNVLTLDCGCRWTGNFPFYLPEKNIVICQHCGEDKYAEFYKFGVKQRTRKDKRYILEHEVMIRGRDYEGILSIHDVFIRFRTKVPGTLEFSHMQYLEGWFENGGRSIGKKFDKNEKFSDIIRKLIKMSLAGERFCTGCGKVLHKNEAAGFPLFAGIECKECWKKTLQKYEEERRTGNVCRLCGKPRSMCYC